MLTPITPNHPTDAYPTAPSDENLRLSMPEVDIAKLRDIANRAFESSPYAKSILGDTPVVKP
jgi:hypothetical protein